MIAPGTDVIAPAFAAEGGLQALRETFAGGAPRLLFLPAALLPHAAAALLDSAEGGARRRQAIADRGSYLEVEPAPSPFLEILGEFAAAVAGEPLRLERAALRELHPGDYALFKDDARSRPAASFVELALDLSDSAFGTGEVTYADGRGTHLAIPQQPLGVVLIERGPELLRRERYVSQRAPGVVVRRLYLCLVRPAAAG